MREINFFMKRLMDIILSAVGIVILIPVYLIIAVAIKATSKGPLLFTQERLGLRGKPFKIIKFRTMVVNAENMGDGIYIHENTDNRITKVGHILRSTSLDELPQLFNVFMGDMSLVGPRPPVTYHPYDGYENYPEWAKKRFNMRPGMTGMVQVTEMRINATWDERMVVDNEYVDKFSLFLDFKILLGTVKTIIRSEAI